MRLDWARVDRARTARSIGPRPDLAADRPATIGTTARFVKTDHVAPVRDYTILIRAEDGRSRMLSRSADLPDEFGIDQSETFAEVTNWIHLQADAECGHTGYRNGEVRRRNRCASDRAVR